jgi:hypothetical protein
MERQLFALSLGFAALVLIMNDVQAQTPQCAPRVEVVAHLAEAFGETRRAMGLTQDNAVVEVFAAEDTRTWTITVTMANGTSCIVAAGESFEALAEHLPLRGVTG